MSGPNQECLADSAIDASYHHDDCNIDSCHEHVLTVAAANGVENGESFSLQEGENWICFAPPSNNRSHLSIASVSPVEVQTSRICMDVDGDLAAVKDTRSSKVEASQEENADNDALEVLLSRKTPNGNSAGMNGVVETTQGVGGCNSDDNKNEHQHRVLEPLPRRQMRILRRGDRMVLRSSDMRGTDLVLDYHRRPITDVKRFADPTENEACTHKNAKNIATKVKKVSIPNAKPSMHGSNMLEETERNHEAKGRKESSVDDTDGEESYLTGEVLVADQGCVSAITGDEIGAKIVAAMKVAVTPRKEEEDDDADTHEGGDQEDCVSEDELGDPTQAFPMPELSTQQSATNEKESSDDETTLGEPSSPTKMEVELPVDPFEQPTQPMSQLKCDDDPGDDALNDTKEDQAKGPESQSQPSVLSQQLNNPQNDGSKGKGDYDSETPKSLLGDEPEKEKDGSRTLPEENVVHTQPMFDNVTHDIVQNDAPCEPARPEIPADEVSDCAMPTDDNVVLNVTEQEKLPPVGSQATTSTRKESQVLEVAGNGPVRNEQPGDCASPSRELGDVVVNDESARSSPVEGNTSTCPNVLPPPVGTNPMLLETPETPLVSYDSPLTKPTSEEKGSQSGGQQAVSTAPDDEAEPSKRSATPDQLVEQPTTPMVVEDQCRRTTMLRDGEETPVSKTSAVGGSLPNPDDMQKAIPQSEEKPPDRLSPEPNLVEKNAEGEAHSGDANITSTQAASRKRTRASKTQKEYAKRAKMKAEPGLKVVTTGVQATQRHKQMIERIGGILLESVDDSIQATHVIAGDNDTPLRRTPKLMIGLCRTSNIVHMDWLVKSARARRALDCSDFLILNDEMAHKKYDFSMRETLENGDQLRRKGKYLLSGWCVYACKGVAGNKAPPESELRVIVSAADGLWLNSVSPTAVTSVDPSRILVVTSDPAPKKQITAKDVSEVLRKGAHQVTASWLFHCMISQDLSGID